MLAALRVIGFIAIAIALVIAVSGPGARLGVWDYGFGLKLVRMMTIPAMVAGAASFVALILARGRLLTPLIGTVAAVLGAYAPLQMKRDFEANPFIHDITTDFADPPQIIAAADLPRKNPPEYLGNEKEPRGQTVSQAQQEAFPDIKTRNYGGSVAQVADAAEAAVKKIGLKIIQKGAREDAGYVIEATDTTFWYGFIDDVVVRIRDGADGVSVDVRSKSRVGGSDLGANAKRVRAFYAALDEQLAG